MDLYDTLRCEYPLPGPNTPSGIFQTKSLEQSLQEYTITVDGRLIWHCVHYEPVPEEEHPNENAPEWEKPLARLLSARRRVYAGDVELPYHGDIFFYDALELPDGGREWLEYQARFTHGRVEWITRVEKPSESTGPVDAHREHFYDERTIQRALHEHLHAICRRLPGDFEPFGERAREGHDCSGGCRHFLKLPGQLGNDWGVCVNPRSSRAGLLTFEHQGCEAFEFGAEPPDPLGE